MVVASSYLLDEIFGFGSVGELEIERNAEDITGLLPNLLGLQPGHRPTVKQQPEAQKAANARTESSITFSALITFCTASRIADWVGKSPFGGPSAAPATGTGASTFSVAIVGASIPSGADVSSGFIACLYLGADGIPVG